MSDTAKRSAVLSPLEELSTLEKLALLSGKNTWETREIPRIGLRSLWMADGPHGVRRQAGDADHLGLNASIPATCFPTAATMANSWDSELCERVGAALGREAAHLKVDVLLGPGVNIKRSPLGGRSFEYFSEDPYLAGKLGAALVRGIQSVGIAACPKHFAVNSQETRRMTSNSVLDQGTLREIYLTAFEILVKESHPKVLMTSYNLVNGSYANEHVHLLNDILRREWGFDGLVVTDWGGGNDPKAAMEAGGTLEMPSPGFVSVAQLLDEGDLDEGALDSRVGELLQLAADLDPLDVDEATFQSGQNLAQEAAENSIVLLKNDESTLPLAAGTRVAVIGEFAVEPRYQGSGSSLVNPTQLTTPLQALRDSSLHVVAAVRGFESGSPLDPEQRAAALAAAREAETVVMYLGLDALSETEGKDRDHMAIPVSQVELLEAVHRVNSNLVVVLAGGSAMEMPWLGKCKAVVHGYLGGQGGAEAMVRVLEGSVNPSGRLAESYPISLEDTPTSGNFPARTKNALYREGPFVGYRYYATANAPVLFPFGYGLSYTDFEYSDFVADSAGANVTVTNAGPRAGSEVVQFYAAPPAEVSRLGPTPSIRLVGFRKVHLEPGQSTLVGIAFDEYSFRSFDRAAGQWITVEGEYQISVNRDAAHPLEKAMVSIDGDPVLATHPSAALPAYAEGRVHDVTDDDFAVLLGGAVPGEESLGVPLEPNSPLSDLEHASGAVGKLVFSRVLEPAMRRMERTGKPNLNLLFIYYMPFRAIYKMGGGMADPRMVAGMLTMVNGRFMAGFGQLVGGYFSNRKRQKALGRRFAELAAGTVTGRNK